VQTTRRMSADGDWYAVRCFFLNERQGSRVYEERITLWRANSADKAIEKAEAEAGEYAIEIPDWETTPYLNFAQAYRLSSSRATSRTGRAWLNTSTQTYDLRRGSMPCAARGSVTATR
jgi:hypothetical protein